MEFVKVQNKIIFPNNVQEKSENWPPFLYKNNIKRYLICCNSLHIFQLVQKTQFFKTILQK